MLSPVLDKLESFDRSVGVQTTRTAIRVVSLLRRGQRLGELDKWSETPVPAGVKYASPEYARILEQSLKEAVGDRRGGTQIWAVTNPDNVRIHSVEVGQAKGAPLSQAVYWAAQNEESFDESETLLDFDVDGAEDVAGSTTQHKRVTAYLVSRESLLAQAELFRSAGYPLAGLIVPVKSTACLIGSGCAGGGEKPLAVSHMSESMARIAIFADGKTRVLRGIPVGMDTLSDGVLESLGKESGVGRGLAQREILEAASTGGDTEVLEAVQPGLDRMARQIERTTAFYQNTFREQGALEEVYSCGQLSGRPELGGLMTGQLSLPLAGLDPFSLPGLQNAGAAPEDESQRLRLGTAMGAALAPQFASHNFLKPYAEREREVFHRRISRWAFVVFLVMAVLLGAVYQNQRSVLSDLRVELEDRESQANQIGGGLDSAGVMSLVAELDRERNYLSRVAREREDLAALIEITRLTPSHIRLNQVSARLDSVEEEDPVRWIRLEGTSHGAGSEAKTRAQLFARNLQVSPLFSEAELEVMSAEAPIGQFFFRINLKPSIQPVEAEIE